MSAPLVPHNDEELRRRRRRNNIALGLVLGALVILFYLLTVVKMGPAIFTTRDL
ncbi:MAG TPA: hypothetical protein VN109_06550 [Devosia sp.]|jgi:hypothetical protein|nr:hypothetical protein [Devosia sp.]